MTDRHPSRYGKRILGLAAIAVTMWLIAISANFPRGKPDSSAARLRDKFPDLIVYANPLSEFVATPSEDGIIGEREGSAQSSLKSSSSPRPPLP